MPDQPGPDGTPLPEEAVVFRLAQSNDGRFPQEAFRLSSADEEQNPPKLSVWDQDQTTPLQALDIMGGSPKHNVAGYLPVGVIRQSVSADLDVIWDRLPLDEERPGAGGHCGLVGLDGAESKAAKERRKQLRRMLADLANLDTRLVG